jgi:hypothetical protein
LVHSVRQHKRYWVEVGKVQADGSGHYEFLAYPGLLQVGQSYAFKVIDEIGNPHELADPVAIKSIKMESVVLGARCDGRDLNTEAGKSYQVISAESLSAATWTASAIYFPVAGGEAGLRLRALSQQPAPDHRAHPAQHGKGVLQDPQDELSGSLAVKSGGAAHRRC